MACRGGHLIAAALCLAVCCSVAAEEQTVSIDVMDVSDYDGDDIDMHDEAAASPWPPSQPRPPSHAEVDQSQTGPQDTGADLPQVTLMSRRGRGRSQDSQHNRLNVCSMLFLYLSGLCGTALCCSVFSLCCIYISCLSSAFCTVVHRIYF